MLTCASQDLRSLCPGIDRSEALKWPKDDRVFEERSSGVIGTKMKVFRGRVHTCDCPSTCRGRAHAMPLPLISGMPEADERTLVWSKIFWTGKKCSQVGPDEPTRISLHAGAVIAIDRCLRTDQVVAPSSISVYQIFCRFLCAGEVIVDQAERIPQYPAKICIRYPRYRGPCAEELFKTGVDINDHFLKLQSAGSCLIRNSIMCPRVFGCTAAADSAS